MKEEDYRFFITNKALWNIIELVKQPESFEVRFIIAVKLFAYMVNALDPNSNLDVDAEMDLKKALSLFKGAVNSYFGIEGIKEIKNWREWLDLIEREAKETEEEELEMKEEKNEAGNETI